MKNLNKHKSVIYTIIAVFLFLSAMPELQAQSVYKILPGKDVNVKVLGSSNVHDWTMVSTGIVSQGEFKIDNDQLRSLTAFSFIVDAKSLKSEHSSMDDRTYKAINADQFPKISFKLTSAAITALQKSKCTIKATGELTISGATKTEVLTVDAVINPDNTITCTGSQKIKLTDFKIQPPSFMLGAMKVKDDLTIQFNLVYKNNQLLTKAN
jgi:polyisoprenoid-binding protein YceI